MTGHEVDTRPRDEIVALSDAELITLTKEGSQQAYEVLWLRYVASARALAYSLVGANQAADVVSEAYLRCLRTIRKGLGPQDAFRPYLLSAVRHVAANMVAKKREVPVGEIIETDDLQVPSAEDGYLGHSSPEGDIVTRAFYALNERYRRVLWMGEVEGAGAEDLATEMGCSLATLYVLRNRAKAALKTKYEAILAADTDHIFGEEPAPSEPGKPGQPSRLGRRVAGSVLGTGTATGVGALSTGTAAAGGIEQVVAPSGMPDFGPLLVAAKPAGLKAIIALASALALGVAGAWLWPRAPEPGPVEPSPSSSPVVVVPSSSVPAPPPAPSPVESSVPVVLPSPVVTSPAPRASSPVAPPPVVTSSVLPSIVIDSVDTGPGGICLPTLRGSALPGSTIVVGGLGISSRQVTVGPDGRWLVALPDAAAGSSTAWASDPSNAQQAASAVVTVQRPPSIGVSVNTGRLRVALRGVAGRTVLVSLDGVTLGEVEIGPGGTAEATYDWNGQPAWVTVRYTATVCQGPALGISVP